MHGGVCHSKSLLLVYLTKGDVIALEYQANQSQRCKKST